MLAGWPHFDPSYLEGVLKNLLAYCINLILKGTLRKKKPIPDWLKNKHSTYNTHFDTSCLFHVLLFNNKKNNCVEDHPMNILTNYLEKVRMKMNMRYYST